MAGVVNVVGVVNVAPTFVLSLPVARAPASTEPGAGAGTAASWGDRRGRLPLLLRSSCAEDPGAAADSGLVGRANVLAGVLCCARGAFVIGCAPVSERAPVLGVLSGCSSPLLSEEEEGLLPSLSWYQDSK